MKKFTTRQYVFMALCSMLGLFSKRLISPVTNIVTDMLHIPGGVGTSFSIMFVIIAAVICDQFGCAMIMCIIQSMVALALGMVGSMGILSPIGYIVPGILIDFIFLFAKKLHLKRDISIVTANAFAAVSASLTANIIIFHLHGTPLILYMMVALTSGSVFGLIGCELTGRLRTAVNSTAFNY